ncbi:unnamed protein product [Arctogadus glacialis]
MSNFVSCSHSLVSGPTWKRPSSEGGLCRGQVVGIDTGRPRETGYLVVISAVIVSLVTEESLDINASLRFRIFVRSIQ